MDIILSILVLITGIYILFTRKDNILNLFIACRILVPESTRFFRTNLSINSFVIILLIIVLVLQRKIIINQENKSLCNILLLYIIYSFISLFASDYGDLNNQLGNLAEFSFTQLLPAIIISLSLTGRENIVRFNKTLFTCAIITCTYGMLSFFLRNNIYVELLTGNVIQESTWKGYSTAATFVSDTTFGYFLTIAIPYAFFALYDDLNQSIKTLVKTAIVFMFVGIFLCRKRSAFISITFFILGLLFVLPKTKKYFNRIIIAIGACVATLIVISQIPSLDKLYNYIKASLLFFDDNSMNVSRGEMGSTMWLRLRQFTYPFTEIKDNLLFGHGVGWCAWYLTTYKLHPILYGFESIFAFGICEFGLMFFMVYPALFISLYKNYLRPNKHVDGKLSLLFVLTYIVNLIACGLNYFFLFLLLLVMIKKTMSFSASDVKQYQYAPNNN